MKLSTFFIFAAAASGGHNDFVWSLSSSSPTAVTQSKFWDNPAMVQQLSDPPPKEILEKIRINPWKGGLEPVPPEGIPLHEVEVVEGTIPKDLSGTIARNGPGRIRIGDQMYGHWFDGDGFITSLKIDGKSNSASFAGAYVMTDRFLAQQSAGSSTFAAAGAWTKRGSGKWWQNLFAIPTNPANTNVLFLNDKTNKTRMYAVCEGGLPVEIDPTTLDTVGEETFQNPTTSAKIAPFFSAHYSKDPITGLLYNHGIGLGPKISLNLCKLDKAELIKQSSTDLDSVTFVHDSVISERYMTMIVQPYEAPSQNSLLTSLFGGKPLGSQFEWNPKGTQETMVYVFSKESLECEAKVSLPLLSTYHLVDSYEEDDLVTLRLYAYRPASSRPELEAGFADMYGRMKRQPICRLVEYKFQVTGGSGKLISEKEICQKEAGGELPDVNHSWPSYKKQFVYLNARQKDSDHLDSIQKIDMDRGDCSEVVSFGDGVYAGSPVFCPKENLQSEDDGYVLTQLYRSKDHGSDVAILDGKSMKKLAILRLQAPVPYQFHGVFQDSRS